MKGMRIRGAICELHKEKGWGRISVVGQASLYFFHATSLSGSYEQLKTLEIGMQVEFTSTSTAKGLQANNVKQLDPGYTDEAPADRESAARPLITSHRNHPPKHNQTDSAKLGQPYNFVPIDIGGAVRESVSFHHGAHQQEERKSGLLQITWTTLTPTLVGHDQIEVGELDGSADAPRQAVPKKKALLPLRANWLPEEPVIWPGSSLKGMLRQSIASLLAAPMERVAERHYTYRPNLDQEAEVARLKRMFGIVVNLDPMRVKLVDPESVWFVHDDRVAAKLKTTPIAGVLVHEARGRKMLHIKPVPKKKNGKPVNDAQGHPVFETKAWSPPLAGIKLHRYLHGADGSAGYASAFRGFHVQPHPLVAFDSVALTSAAVVRIPPGVEAQWNHTQRIMRDSEIGHRRGKHPNQDKPGYPSDSKSFANLNVNDVVIVEVDNDTKEVVTLGHYFNYRTAYADSVRQRLVLNDGKFVMEDRDREEVRPLPNEQVSWNKKESSGGGKLSGARGLFGYAGLDAAPHGKLQLGKGDFSRLAGRIGCNHAVEVIKSGETEDHAARFVRADDLNGFWVALKELGSPKPSAVENYLDQTDTTEAKPRAGTLLTYGDAYPSGGGHLEVENRAARLRGRKVYPHQAAVRLSDFHDIGTMDNDRAMLARFVSDKNIAFRSAIHYQDLKSWEFGALLAAVEPGEFARWVASNVTKHRANDFPKLAKQLQNIQQNDSLAHKLGHGRPLGLGSVKASIDNVDNAQRNAALTALWQVITAAATADPQRLDRRLAAWFRARKFAGTQVLAYPKLADKNGAEAIFNYHTDLRKRHAVARRKEVGSERLTASALRPLEELS